VCCNRTADATTVQDLDLDWVCVDSLGSFELANESMASERAREDRNGNTRSCVVIPALNAAASIANVVRGAIAHGLPVFVVDDGSSDPTAEVARDAGARIVTHAENRGKGAALLSGLVAAQQCDFTHAVTLDADGQHDPREIPRLLQASERSLTALVIGARDFSVPHVPSGSRFGRNFSNFWVRLETGQRLSDTQSGYRVYPVDLILALGVPRSRFEWEVEVIVRAKWAGLPVVEVPVSVYYPPPADRASHYRGVVDSTRISLLHFRLIGRLLLWPVWRHRRLLPRERAN
jgi:glycosyltransferase involved in cell wall biosynthesis